MTIWVALDVGGSHVAGAVVDVPQRRYLSQSYRHRPLSADGSAAAIVEAIAECAAAVSPLSAAHLAVAVPGPFDYAAGVGDFHGVGKFDALRGVDLGTALARRLPELRSRAVFLNDAHAFGIGEYLTGPAAGTERLVAITLGTGVGSAFVERGVPTTSGSQVPPEGRADRLTIDDRPLEETVSARALRRRYQHLSGVTAPDVASIAALARAGDAPAAEVFRTTFSAAGLALGPWLQSFAAQALVLGGSISRSGDLVLEPLRAGIDRAVPGLAQGVRITRSDSDRSTLVGAAWVAAGRPAPEPQNAPRPRRAS